MLSFIIIFSDSLCLTRSLHFLGVSDKRACAVCVVLLLVLSDVVCTHDDFLSGPLMVTADRTLINYSFVWVDTFNFIQSSFVLWSEVLGWFGSDFVGTASGFSCGMYLIIDLSKCSEQTKWQADFVLVFNKSGLPIISSHVRRLKSKHLGINIYSSP